MYYILFIILFIGIGLPSPGIAVDAGQTPVRVIEHLQAELISIDQRFLDKPELNARVAALTQVIEATHDLPYMARLTVKAYWNTLDESQRERFVHAFSELSIATYDTRFRDLADIRFRTVAERQLPRGRVEVQTELIEANGTTVALNYILQDTANGWRIINILADGVSELALKRSQYQRVLESQDIESLLTHLQQQHEDLERDATD